MEDIIYKFGLDPKLIVGQMINFAVLLGLLTYFLYKPVLRVLNEREETIKKGIADAEAAAAAKAEADDSRKEVLTVAHKDAEEISVRAKTAAETKAADILKAAEDKAAQVVRTAESKGADLKAAALKESEAEIAKLAILAAEKVMRKEA